MYYVVRLSKGGDGGGVCEIYEDGYLKESFSVPVPINQLYNQPIYVGDGTTNTQAKHILPIINIVRLMLKLLLYKTHKQM